ncbi:unnamed protein product [Pieris brassicae]|uniref:Uncharacterized protein n=1 Tax=Pieris brassicae TaxID=7116 RepID=A0A9P0XBY3_PIEBR|nr:unnamed protein product [Pieris brassicae]
MVALDLVEARGLIESNAVGFLSAKGADDKMVKTLLDLYRQCARAVTQIHHCAATLDLANCFRRDLYHFWKEDYGLLKRDTGCAIMCMSQKLQLVDTSGNLHHGNAQEFAVKHGAEVEVAQKLVNMVHECEKQHQVQEDPCERALEVAKCFRSGIHLLKWTPTVEVLVGEVLTEV